jgi:anaerobic ribonucleoside-triphosphate reductase activating protein
MNSTVQIARCHYPVRGLGFGRRVGVWFQGCSIRCRGCIVPETWHTDPSRQVSLQALLEALLPWLDRGCDGVTISGGEPFDQAEALFALLTALRVLTNGDLLLYSGYAAALLRRRYPEILQCAYVLVSQPYVAALRESAPILRGSRNQQVHLLTPLAQQRYADWQNFPPAIGVALGGDSLDLAGLLRPGDLTELARRLHQRGWPTGLTHREVQM